MMRTYVSIAAASLFVVMTAGSNAQNARQGSQEQPASENAREQVPKETDITESAAVLSVSDKALYEACEVLLSKSGFTPLLRATPENIRKVARLLSADQMVSSAEATLDESTQLFVDLPNVGFFGKGTGRRDSACFIFDGETMRAQLSPRDAIVLSYAAEELARRGVKAADIESMLLPQSLFVSSTKPELFKSKVGTVYFLEQKGRYVVNVENPDTGKVVVSATVRFRSDGGGTKQ
jgi:hypothetical protein